MADAPFLAGGTVQGGIVTPLQWNDMLFHRVRGKTFFDRLGMVGKDAQPERVASLKEDAVVPAIVRARDLEKKQGDTITFTLLNNFVFGGKYGTNAIQGEDEEEALSFSYMKVAIELWRKAVKETGFMVDQRNPTRFKMPALTRNKLADWIAEKFDDEIFYALYHGWGESLIGSYVSANAEAADTAHPTKKYAGSATSDATLNSGCVLNCQELLNLRTYAVVNHLPKIEMKGFTGWLYIAHPYQTATLTMDAEWVKTLQLANWKGKDNPIYTQPEFLGIYRGIMVAESDSIAYVGASGDDAKKRKGLLLGGHSTCVAVGKGPFFTRKYDPDYDLNRGVAINQIFGTRRHDWTEDKSGDTAFNQSSIEHHTWAEDPS